MHEVFKGLPGRALGHFNDLTVDAGGSVYVGTVNGEVPNVMSRTTKVSVW